MTREEAIAKFEKQLTSAMVVLDSGFGTRPGESDRVYQERKELAEIALSALRQQEHFRDVTKKVPMTNADRIRAMDDEELAGFLMKLMRNVQCFAEGMFPYHPCPQSQNCKQCGIEWLQMPAEEDDHVV